MWKNWRPRRVIAPNPRCLRSRKKWRRQNSWSDLCPKLQLYLPEPLWLLKQKNLNALCVWLFLRHKCSYALIVKEHYANLAKPSLSAPMTNLEELGHWAVRNAEPFLSLQGTQFAAGKPRDWSKTCCSNETHKLLKDDVQVHHVFRSNIDVKYVYATEPTCNWKAM